MGGRKEERAKKIGETRVLSKRERERERLRWRWRFRCPKEEKREQQHSKKYSTALTDGGTGWERWKN